MINYLIITGSLMLGAFALMLSVYLYAVVSEYRLKRSNRERYNKRYPF